MRRTKRTSQGEGYNYNVDYLGNLWFTDQSLHEVLYISKEQDEFNAIFKIAGKPHKEGESTYRNGNLAKATFNKPSSIAIYNRNYTKI